MTDHTYSNLVQTKLPQSFSIRELLKRREQKAPSELMPAMLRASVPAPPSVVALARALKHDVDLIYEWVYSNVDFYGTWGARKGAFGALVDRAANACDQSILMVALLQASGYTAEFVVGSIRLAKEQLENLLGTADDSESNPSSAQMLSAGGIFNTPTYVDGELEYIDLDHVWVRVVIDGVYYMFDPTFKTYTYTAMVEDLGEILDYDESALTTAAQVGATVDGRSVQNLNKPNIFEKFQTYGTNLLDYLREEENFAASMEDVIGGREIQPLSGTPVRQTSLPYQTPDEEPSYYEDNLPDELRYLYKVSVGGLEEIFYFDAVYGKRMTITFNGSMEPELKLDGVLQAGGDEQTPDVFITATYGIGVEPDELVTWTQRLYTDPDGVTFLAMAWGPTSQSMVDYHRQVLQQNISAGGVDGDENVLGESLAVYHFMHEAQLTAAHRICGQLGNSSIFHRALGTVSWTSFSQGPLFDYAFNSLSASSRINDFSTASKTKAAACLYVFGLEGAIVQQNLPVMGISTARFLEQTTQKIYSGNVLNWFTGPTVRDLLTNWTLAPLDAVILSDGEVVVHQDGESTIGDFVGGGYMDIRNSDNISGILAGQLFGGAGSEPTSKEQMNKGAKDSPPKSNNPCPCPCGSPISLFRGSMVEDWGDISVGSGAFPYSLTFSRHYDSQQRFSAGPLGAGWTHNLDARVSVGSNALRALGELSPKEAAAAIAHIFVAIQLDIPSEQITNHLKTVIAVISMQWLFDELCTNNSVMFTEGGASSTFIKLVDGTYNPQFGSADTLTLDGTFSIKSPQQLTWNFNSDGQLETYVDPAGVTVTYTYSSGLLQSVSNGLDRTLTFSYEDGLLESVSDGDRSVSFAIEDGNLVAFTDAESNSTTYAYVALGLMNEYFRPANPLVPMVVNTFDSGGNVLTQTPANEGTSNYFCSGFRAERVNALGNSTVTYFNSYGSPLREFDAEGNETVYEYDGLNRLVGTTYPEGNRLLLEYDNSSVEVSQNILKKTWQAKPGSLLSDIEQVLEYDTPWNKVASAKDGEGNTTIFSYDATQGTLIQTNRPSLTTVSVTTITIAGAPPSGPYLQTVRVAGQAATYLADTGDSDSDIAGALSTAINALSLSGVSSTSSGADILLTAPVGTTLTATGLGGITISNAIFVNLGYTYTARGQVETRTDETGIVDKFEYNATNETLEKATRDFGMGRLNLETQFGYNAWGDVNSITDPRGNTTTFDFDQERRMIERVECAPFEFQTIWEYNPNGELIRLKRQAEPGPDPELFQEWQWAYRVNGDVETITDPAGNLLTFVYNLIALLISRTDAEGRQWKFAYDANNRITVVTDPSGNASETRTYTDNGMLASITDARGNTTTMSQDGFDRLETRTYPDTTTEEFTYNQNNQVLTLVTRNGDTIENTYDVLTRLSTRLAGTLPLQTMQYDLAGRLEKVSTPAVEADPSSGEFGFGYDTAGRLTSQSSPTGEDPPVYREIQYELDQNGNRTKLIYPDAYFAFYVFDELNRLTDIKLDSEVDPSAIQFVYDELSRRTGLTYINGCSCVAS
jgi:YD repeat-containing protein